MPRVVGCEHNPEKYCGACVKQKKKEWYERNKEREQEKARLYYEAHREELCAKKRGTYESTPETREDHRNYQKRYRTLHPEKQSERLYGAIFPAGSSKALLRERQRNRCGGCKQEPRPKDPLVIDHDHG